MRKGSWKKPVFGTLGVLAILAGVWLAKLIWFKPFNIDHFYNRVFIEFAIESPEMLSQMRMLPAWADWYNDELDSRDPSGAKEDFEELRETLEMLHSYDVEDQTESQKLSTRILEWFLENNLRGEEFMHHNYPVNQLFGVQSNLPTFMVETHQIKSEEEARDYVARLNQFGRVFSEVREGLVIREEKGILPPTFVVDRVMTEIDNFVSDEPTQHILYTNMEEKLAEVEDIDDAARSEILAQTEDAVANVVYPAYEGLLGYLNDIKPKTTSDDGVWKLPNGDEFYHQALRTHTTTDLNPLEVHDIGLREVDSIQSEMDAILRAEGYSEGTVGERMLALAEEERFLYPDTDQGREQILEDYQKILDEIDAGLAEAFDLRPEADVEVKRIPEFKEKTSPGAYYNMPARDGSRPGVFYANLRSVKEIPQYGMRTLAYHEGIPGHHYQIALQSEMQGLPIFRTFPLFTAYTEGWALYSEQVAAEMGFQEDPYDRLGYLQAALFRAVRLVVDTGIHAKKWTREEAIEYMTNNTGMPKSDVVAEIERYIVMPGQACAYMIGKLKILELRKRAREALGEDFEIAEFHRVVLENGALPLSLLEEQVDKWIAASS